MEARRGGSAMVGHPCSEGVNHSQTLGETCHKSVIKGSFSP